jgi:hypothetical protein
MSVKSRVVLGALLVPILLPSPLFAGAAVTYTDVTSAAGVSASINPSDDAPGVPMWGGICVGDFNNDGWPDIFVAGGGDVTDLLFINDQDGTFTESASSWGLTDSYRGNGCAVGDYDNDGDLDLFVNSDGDVTVDGGGPTDGQQRLYRNNGSSFTNVASSAGVTYTVTSNIDFFPFGASFGDYDLDGDLDLFVNTWVPQDDGGGNAGQTDGNRLFRNNGDGTFTDVTSAAGVADVDIHGFGSRFVDMNLDRYPELLITADFHSSRYGLNNKNGTFTLSGCEVAGGNPEVPECDDATSDATPIGHDRNGMGNAVLDWNGDGDFDWYITSIWKDPTDPDPPRVNNGNMMYSNLFVDLGINSFVQEDGRPEGSEYDLGATDGGWGWGTVAIDFDLDGDVDIVETNGWSADTTDEWDDDPSYFFRNNRIGLGTFDFTEIHASVGLTSPNEGRALNALDYDRDGDLDLILSTRSDCDTVGCAASAPIFLYRNDLILAGSGPNRGVDPFWLQVVLNTNGNPALGPNGYGATVQITYNTLADGTVVQRSPLCGGSNFIGQSELLVTFGLGSSETVDEVKVEWPDGNNTIVTSVAADQRITITAPKNYVVTGPGSGGASKTRRIQRT